MMHDVVVLTSVVDVGLGSVPSSVTVTPLLAPSMLASPFALLLVVRIVSSSIASLPSVVTLVLVLVSVVSSLLIAISSDSIHHCSLL
jgi:hypothetical protein